MTRGVSAGSGAGKLLVVFETSNDEYFAQDKLSKMKLVWLELPDHEDSEYVIKIKCHDDGRR
jgi:hypothetical protein